MRTVPIKYKEVKDIPVHIFNNKECTSTPSKPLQEYLRYMYDNHRDDLDYIFRYAQQYTLHGGCYTMSWARWLDRLERDLIKMEGNK